MVKKQERLNNILSILKTVPGISIHHLAGMLSVSEMTIRRDVNELAAKEYVNLIQGVAILNKNKDGSAIAKEYSLSEEREIMKDAKSRIGALACTLIEDNDSILVDTGTTTEQIFTHLPANLALTIVCFNMNTLSACINREKTDIIFAGGFYHRNTQMFESVEGASLISRICINKYFCSAAGISQKGAVSCIEQHEILTKQRGLKAAHMRILLADSSKFGKIRPCMFASLSSFDVIITDTGISPEWLKLFDDMGKKYMLA
ncbi:MAG: DeoR/GlpR transcriptional regulator [Clostridia bacterium]|nr:DeoR/GlpR transcriptional regulator [Clostridia bacterium]MBR6860346.1 DeoR/GlpR transcriptional regulator [Acidaminococcaceae bacterium]